MLTTDKETIKERLNTVARSLKKIPAGEKETAIAIIKGLKALLKQKDSSFKKAQIISQGYNLKTFFSPHDHSDSIEEIVNSPYLALEDLIQRARK
ncbi:hypothetical protein FJZ41_01545 [Candidatus Shapirobacteria bacterium]|nr:hypothetical protein [Candidatus Shapirobacteria bacterium]